jgi:DNA-binding NarL/FixJ family response regulator
MAGQSPTAENIRVLVVDDQAAVRDGLSTLLDLCPGIEVVAQASDGEQALAAIAAHAPDVALMDLHMPVLDGIAATARISAEFPGTRVVVLTTYADDSSIRGALRAGALGFLTKDSGRAEIARAVQAAAVGQSVLDGAVQRRLVAAATGDELFAKEDRTGQVRVTGTADPAADGDSAAANQNPGSQTPVGQNAVGQNAVNQNPGDLTARELEVLRLIAAGRSNADIAEELFVSAATVKTHINHLFAKTGVRDRSQAVRYAYQNGLVR